MAAPERFPEGGSRAVVFVIYDRRGRVDDFIIHALTHLRAHAQRIVAVVNGKLLDEARTRLEAVADDVLQRENTGMDIWGQKAGLDLLGDDIDRYDEVILTNDTWFGPVRPFAPVFDEMDAEQVDFWGLTDHPRVEREASWTGDTIPYHLQSFWIAVRRRMLGSEAWREYWRSLPVLDDWTEAVTRHEVTFTERFASLGFQHRVAFGHERYDTENPSIFNAEQMLDDGCPIIKRKPFFFWPVTMDHEASIGKWVLEKVESFGYPRELIMPNLARNSPPRDLTTDLGMLDILPDIDVSYDPDRPLRVVLVAHIFYVDMTDEILDRGDLLPCDYDLVVTTPDARRAREIEEILHSRRRPGRRTEVRVLPSNDGRDQSAFLIACRDLIIDDRYDVIVKVHTKRTPQQGYTVGQHFKGQQLDNLLPSAGYAANLIALFQNDEGLGLAYPPMIHIGHGTLGHAWWGNRPRFERVAAELGISVPVDDVSPLAPFGSMYAARPAALRLLAERDWRYEEFGGKDAYKDGGLAHVLERLPSYAAAERGFHTRTVLTAEYAALSHTSLEFKVDEMAATLPGSLRDKTLFLHRAGWIGTGRASDFFWMYLRFNKPETVARWERVRDVVTAPRRAVRALTQRLGAAGRG
ncbi:lipopolysaccharide biosynthesis protein [Microbacterium sp. SORGH_AS 1204]|uniref:rhamnan synthesis F family protein n=1 Tax=Microbacterium sp. SORGH_AS_1204 TaxID=3041785 RepID=UPI00278D989E|nr:rhamnan synthesis F family protein [Microbacterium sp. SORGH_AS_1204]MDQ1137599.1 lipopolysaccharide biosynthesis protein [Microbacterium sp. SORGH_AS_1204]